MSRDKHEVSSRWWVDATDKSKAQADDERLPLVERFYSSIEGYEQDEARERLTDNNLKIIEDAQPPEGGWSYVALADTQHPEKARERIQRTMKLPAYARGVLVDSGKHVRVLLTGTPAGERILEFTFGYAPSFDCWIGGEWVHERVFRNPGEVLEASGRLISRYLSPEAIARAEAIAPRV